MRRNICYAFGLVMAVILLCACGSDTSANSSGSSGLADSGLPEDGSWASGRYLRGRGEADLYISANGEPIQMHIQEESVSCDDLRDGDEIQVYIVGGIMESWPAQAYVYAVEKLSDGDIADIPPELLEQLRELGWLEQLRELGWLERATDGT